MNDPVTNTIQEQAAPELIKCPCCGELTLKKPLKLNGALFDYYMSCVVSGTPFSYMYPLYNGKLHVTVSQLPKKEYTALSRAISALQRIPSKDGKAKDAVKDIIFNIQLYAGIMEIGTDSFTVKPHDAVEKICKRILDFDDQGKLAAELGNISEELDDASLFSSVPMSVISEVVSVHNKVYALLLDASVDENFWEGIVLL